MKKISGDNIFDYCAVAEQAIVDGNLDSDTLDEILHTSEILEAVLANSDDGELELSID